MALDRLDPKHWLTCPDCDAPAIPPSAENDGDPMWHHEDEADCPGCGLRLGARPVEPDCADVIAVVLPPRRRGA
jgi:hypothetical protein